MLCSVSRGSLPKQFNQNKVVGVIRACQLQFIFSGRNILFVFDCVPRSLIHSYPLGLYSYIASLDAKYRSRALMSLLVATYKVHITCLRDRDAPNSTDIHPTYNTQPFRSVFDPLKLTSFHGSSGSLGLCQFINTRKHPQISIQSLAHNPLPHPHSLTPSLTNLRGKQDGRLGVRPDGLEDQDAGQHEERRHEHDERPHLLVSLEGEEAFREQGHHLSPEERFGPVDA